MTVLSNSNGRILIVDDKKEIREIVSKLLAHLGYDVVAANSGKEGLGLFLDSPFNLVITDLNMPEVDGLAFAFSIKERSPHTPIVLMTGSGLNAAQRDPVDFIMHKPFTLMDLQQTVQMFMGG